MAETAGILGSQERAKTSATTTRTTSKSFLIKKVAKWSGVGMVFLALLFWWRILPSENKPILPSTSPAQTERIAQVTPVATPVVTQGEAKWSETAEDGSLPANVWSEPVKIGVDCRLHFYLDDKIKGEWLDRQGKWNTLAVGSNLDNAIAVRFMFTENGPPSYPYKRTCS